MIWNAKDQNRAHKNVEGVRIAKAIDPATRPILSNHLGPSSRRITVLIILFALRDAKSPITNTKNRISPPTIGANWPDTWGLSSSPINAVSASANPEMSRSPITDAVASGALPVRLAMSAIRATSPPTLEGRKLLKNNPTR